MPWKYFLTFSGLFFSFCWWFPLLYRRFLFWYSPTYLFLLLLPFLMVLNPKYHHRDWCQGAYHLCFLLEVLWCQFLWSSLWDHVLLWANEFVHRILSTKSLQNHPGRRDFHQSQDVLCERKGIWDTKKQGSGKFKGPGIISTFSPLTDVA